MLDYTKFALPLPVCDDKGKPLGVMIELQQENAESPDYAVVISPDGRITFIAPEEIRIDLAALGEGEKEGTYLVDALRAIYRLESRSGVDAIVSIRQIARTALGLAEENGDGQ